MLTSNDHSILALFIIKWARSLTNYFSVTVWFYAGNIIVYMVCKPVIFLLDWLITYYSDVYIAVYIVIFSYTLLLCVFLRYNHCDTDRTILGVGGVASWDLTLLPLHNTCLGPLSILTYALYYMITVYLAVTYFQKWIFLLCLYLVVDMLILVWSYYNAISPSLSLCLSSCRNLKDTCVTQ